ncbi:MAG: guanylate kinase [Candidatus Vogelbacteria bacterium CG10_big_fil_rev_8_21_14_0_10_51_16]|uniref:Guanylate kinase n=1 Tax=Candidatus Vogelbacteria bacterium CG10_big_fil_rev_8_21_14_0_10_51_16 TaxID=1975045 RepID=A0A2H0RDR4_9BACT|nr:MAG: guanylate kinase [Candidatus Vogelbacteria bacterium CG10_big_fil_rev_8_21_14_0_10_51_16]
MSKIVILVGPSGVGKDALRKGLEDRIAGFARVVTATSRRPRINNGTPEVHGAHYWFYSIIGFVIRVLCGFFVEWKMIHGHLYGLPWFSLHRALEEGVPLVDLDYRGARDIKRRYPGALTVFVVPPHPQVLAERLRRRGDNRAQIYRRLVTAEEELKHCRECDHQIVNADFGTALNELVSIVGDYLWGDDKASKQTLA